MDNVRNAALRAFKASAMVWHVKNNGLNGDMTNVAKFPQTDIMRSLEFHEAFELR